MKAIIIDDEPKAIELLKGYLNHFEGIELVETFRNGLKACEFIAKVPIDLIFLDINMPHISGITLSKIIPNTCSIIFTTAHSEYAVESYTVHAVDYLLKPISLNRFTQAISKVLQTTKPKPFSDATWLLIKSGFDTFRIEHTAILYLEKEGNYMTYVCETDKILGRETIQEALNKLPSSFLQTHKSFIVNTNKITRYDRTSIYLQKHKIPLSESYRQAVFDYLESKV